jgi:hypothetical protein
MKKALLLFLFAYQINTLFSQSSTCITATPFCTATSITYPAAQNTTAQLGPNYGCLFTQPNPAWFYCKFVTPGNLIINMTNSANVDIDFVCWGPFSSSSAGCSGLDTTQIMDCSYSSSSNETLNIPAAQTGEYYIVMITNYSNQATDITFSVTGGTGTISCEEVCITHAYYNQPLCVNGTLQLLATDHLGAGTYSWTGPNGFTSNQKNPTINAVDLTNAGYYYINYTLDTSCNYFDSVLVAVDTCGSLSGRVYADANNNCMYDSTENYVANAKIKLSQNENFVAFAWTDPYGYYYFDVPLGSYTIELMSTTGYTITCSGSMAHSTTVTTSLTTENFAIDCSAFDLVATGVSVSQGFFPGLTIPVFPHIQNYSPDCNQSYTQGSVTVILDSLVQYSGSYYGGATPDTIITSATGDTLVWTIADIYAAINFGYLSNAFTVTTNTSATIGDTVCITVIISVVQGESDTTNNVYTGCFAVGNSYDPNSKDVIPRGEGVQGFIPPSTERLEYTIHFQNMGTAAAHNIYIMDTLSANVDVSSLEIISASHPQTTTLLSGNVLKFNFANIMLPDTAHDEPNSHGYVKYSIGLNSGLTPGTPIENTAYIYFDYNPPVITNTAINTIEFPASIKDFSTASLSVFPNPANNSITIQFAEKNTENISLKFINVTGQIIHEENASVLSGKFSKVLDISTLPKGIYLLQIGSENGSIQQKVVKE